MQISMDAGLHNTPIMPIDTLAISKRLQAAGTPKKQAEAQAEVLAEIMLQNLASKMDIENVRKDIENLRKETKTDIESLRKDTKTDIENLRKDTKTDIENLRKDLTIEIGKIKIDILKWFIPLMAGQLMAAAGLMKMFIH